MNATMCPESVLDKLKTNKVEFETKVFYIKEPGLVTQQKEKKKSDIILSIPFLI